MRHGTLDKSSNLLLDRNEGFSVTLKTNVGLLRRLAQWSVIIGCLTAVSRGVPWLFWNVFQT